MTTVDLLIGGRSVAASNGNTFDRIDPVTGEVATRAAAATLEDADAAVAAAQAAFPAWSAFAAAERRKRLMKAADVLDSMTAGFIATGIAETGSTPMWYGFNVMLAANMLRETAAMTTQISGSVLPSCIPGNVAMAVRRPCGVVLGICHINGPTVHDEGNMPFGGVKDCGYGRFGGTAAIAEFTDLRWITLQTKPRHYPI
jgi:vanillin dehydrogenase